MTSLSPLAGLSSAKNVSLPRGLEKGAGDESVESARKLRDAYGQFVGETFFGQMLKSMRATVGEPAYFHGGMAEEQFQARLDQQVSQDLAAAGGSGLAAELFRHEFPDEAALLDAASAEKGSGLAALDTLRRR